MGNRHFAAAGSSNPTSRLRGVISSGAAFHPGFPGGSQARDALPARGSQARDALPARGFQARDALPARNHHPHPRAREEGVEGVYGSHVAAATPAMTPGSGVIACCLARRGNTRGAPRAPTSCTSRRSSSRPAKRTRSRPRRVPKSRHRRLRERAAPRELRSGRNWPAHPGAGSQRGGAARRALGAGTRHGPRGTARVPTAAW